MAEDWDISIEELAYVLGVSCSYNLTDEEIAVLEENQHDNA
jgi:hypothetical protein